MSAQDDTNDEAGGLQQRPRVEVHISPSSGSAWVLSDYPLIEREGDDGPISIAWVQEVCAVFRSDVHDLMVVTTDSANVYLMTIEEYESKFDGYPASTVLAPPVYAGGVVLCRGR